ncbi:hypothetical protein [Methanofollis aquaemaris]|uniref:hypothetical protein n=1 Tax=Methanofollis aquaemaris TaxID=126734 RepID=UPI00223EEE9D|nr:hypothetical protein [Methanofollis aquaemaris]
MNDFEQDVVHCHNDFFTRKRLQGSACWLKQHKYSTQYVDVLVDSLDSHQLCAIECTSLKSKKDLSGEDRTVRLSDRRISGRFRSKEPGPPDAMGGPAHLWRRDPGIRIEDFENCTPLERTDEAYILNSL